MSLRTMQRGSRTLSTAASATALALVLQAGTRSTGPPASKPFVGEPGPVHRDARTFLRLRAASDAALSPEEYTAYLQASGFGAAEVSRSSGTGNILEVLPVVLLGLFVILVGLAALLLNSLDKTPTFQERMGSDKDFKLKWGAEPSSVPEDVAPHSEGEPNDKRANRRKFLVASQKDGCRVFDAVEQFGRDRNTYNDEYQLFNHINMATDRPRVEAYRSALKRLAVGRQVLDVGTGAFCLLSRLALRAGARSVDCVEESEGAVKHAVGIFKSEAAGVEVVGLQEIDASFLTPGLLVTSSQEAGSGAGPKVCVSLNAATPPKERQLQLFQGFSSNVPLSGGYNLVVQEILGHIASSEGVVPAILDLRTRGLVTPDCVFVPRRATTLFVPTDKVKFSGVEQMLAVQYGSGLKELQCSTKYHVNRFSENSFLAEPAVFEDLDFGGDLQATQSRTVEFVTTRDGVFDGLHFHMLVDMDGLEGINTLAYETTWRTTYVKLLDRGISLPAGSKILCKTSVKLDQAAPEYSVEVTVSENVTEPVVATFAWSGCT